MLKNFSKRLAVLLLAATPLSTCCCADALVINIHIMEQNPCYTEEKKPIVPKAIMVHSTATPGVRAAAWFDMWNKPVSEGGREVGVHAFLDDKEVWQYLPWTHRAWHAGGKANDTHLSIEMCEPPGIRYDSEWNTYYDPSDLENKRYFNAALKNMVELCAKLCREFKIDPSQIISHSEGYALGLASSHKDPEHWWCFHRVNMEFFRGLVSRELAGKSIIYNF